MPFNYKSPGVYVEEVDKGARPIESAGTSVLALVGFVADSIKVEKPGQGTVVQPTPTAPTLITNWTEFTNTYGDFDQAVPGGYLHHSVFGYFLNGGTGMFVVGLPVKGAGGAVPQLTSGEAYLLNAAGQRLLRVATSGPMKEGDKISVEAQAAASDAPDGSFNLVITRSGAAPQTIGNLTTGKPAKGQRAVADAVAKDTDNALNVEIVEGASGVPAIGSKAALAPAAASAKPVMADALKAQGANKVFVGNAAQRTGIAGLEAIDEVTLVACPDIIAAFEAGAASEDDVKAVQTAILNHCEAMKDRFAILDMPSKLNVQEAIDWRKNRMNFDSKYGALYYPWIKVAGATIPSSGFVAGVYARVDGERGVHKAPANEVVRGAIGLANNISRNEQDFLNPIGVNCTRAFPGRGIRIWGARTLSSDAQWRYINVRRLFANVEESILQGTQWIVFEPNDQVLWRQIRRDVSAFLNVVWRSGALFGATAEEAFYVKCDLETNPKELRDLGYCIVEVGMAPVKPAEFVVFRVSQKSDGAGSASE
ncbi:MAG: phage tail sheath family protein [Chloroflexi bacterium]|nr:phage tail sheath family protein [Chloroflexota bacterium]